MTEPQIRLDPAVLAAKLEARYRLQLTRQAEEISSLIAEIAQLETYAQDLARQLAELQPTPDPWGDEKGPE
jgi:hypothetical protein